MNIIICSLTILKDRNTLDSKQIIHITYVHVWFSNSKVLYPFMHYLYYSIYAILVPTPSVSVTGPTTHKVGQSLTLQCKVTAVRGITSSVDIEWRRDGAEVQRMDNVKLQLNTMNTSLVYRDTYTISLLTTSDERSMLQCKVVINSSLPVMATSSLRVNVKGMYICM